jgi:hypothetical protein
MGYFLQQRVPQQPTPQIGIFPTMKQASSANTRG